jgi:hypothetical protein
MQLMENFGLAARHRKILQKIRGAAIQMTKNNGLRFRRPLCFCGNCFICPVWWAMPAAWAVCREAQNGCRLCLLVLFFSLVDFRRNRERINIRGGGVIEQPQIGEALDDAGIRRARPASN